QLGSRLFNLPARVVLTGRFRDTQCGLKGFRADAARVLFSHARIDGFAFDVELLHLAERYGLSITEVPVALRSSPGSSVRFELAAAFAEGVGSCGVDVVDLGLVSTDLVYFASGKLDAPAAMFTASHNPAAYNGIKLCLSGARPVGVDTGLREIKAAVASGATGDADRRGAVTRVDLLDEYAAHVRSFVDASVLRPLRVIADTANGMGGLVAPKVFEGL